MNGEGVMPCNDVYLCCGRKVVVEVGGCYWKEEEEEWKRGRGLL